MGLPQPKPRPPRYTVAQFVKLLEENDNKDAYLRHAAVPFTRQERVMPVPFRHAEHSH